jgi:hypothetical protein
LEHSGGVPVDAPESVDVCKWEGKDVGAEWGSAPVCNREICSEHRDAEGLPVSRVEE